MATPTYNPTDADRNQVKTLIGFGIIADDVCKTIINPHTGKSISRYTLFKHFRKEIDSGELIANTKVAQNLFKIATGDSRNAVTAAIFWLKTRAHWKEQNYLEIGGGGENTIKVQFVKPGTAT